MTIVRQPEKNNEKSFNETRLQLNSNAKNRKKAPSLNWNQKKATKKTGNFNSPENTKKNQE